MDKKVNAHIKSIVNKTNFNRRQKKDFQEYLRCNFEEDYNNYISQNFSSELALNKALDNLEDSSEFSYELEECNINKYIQFIAIAGLTLSVLAVILANNHHATWVDQLEFTFYDAFLSFFNINIFSKISEMIKLEQFFSVFSMTMFFIPVGFFLPVAMNKINMEKHILYSFALFTCIFEFSKIWMMANPRLIFILLNFIACISGYIILRIVIMLLLKATNLIKLIH